jgi:histidine triad (HIT) family protein
VGSDCVFCAIAEGDASAEVICEDEETMAFMDIHPAAQGHTLVIPKEHFRNIYDIEEEVLLATARTTMKVARAVRAAFVSCRPMSQVASRASSTSIFISSPAGKTTA